MQEARRKIQGAGLFPAVSLPPGAISDGELLAEMVAYGDSGAFLDKVRPRAQRLAWNTLRLVDGTFKEDALCVAKC